MPTRRIFREERRHDRTMDWPMPLPTLVTPMTTGFDMQKRAPVQGYALVERREAS
jgi:hypothetical protein